ncbi:putative disease resistance protein RGA1 [Mercurialis annua]|uniref:putative disease resistance protein RGA1 n=1 Tax=Mercurialis annua TaxID=3986 RepID=UPI00215FDCFC|nr:putative disease resistance protein RGA1 [Mercurialis annua]
MAGVGEAFLSAAFQVAIEKLATPILAEFGCRLGVEKDLKRLGRTLSKIKAVLNDAESKRISDSFVQSWLNDLKEVAYDAEDLLDEFSTEAFRYNQQKKVTKLLSAPKKFIFKAGLAPKIKEINERLDEIAKERDDLGLKEGVGVSWTDTRDKESLQTSSLIDESRVFGRTDDVKTLVELLVSDKNCGNDVGIVPIVGMGGLGKTTLAQLVFNDSSVVEHFAVKVWICVSDDFNVRKLTKSILECIERKNCDLVDLDTLQTSLRDKLRGKKFLIVLDDVWNEKERDWEVLRLPFRAGALGSKIIVTTRSEKVALIMGTSHPYRLDVLSFKDCWLLFKQRAFVDGNECAHPNLIPIGEEIVKKCRGLPLAAKALGGVLHAKTEVTEWEMIMKNDIWELEEEENGILPALRLSYDQLPAHLKQCFIYCSIFPKDYNLDKEDLVLLWMAEGFVHPKGRRRMEDVASDYFDDLWLRSFFQQSKTYDLSKFIMHDLIHDLAQSTAGEICFRLEGDKVQNIPEKARYLSVLMDTFKSATFEALHTAKSLRTMLLLCNKTSSQVSNVKVPHDLLCSLKCLRSLDMSRIAINDVSDLVGDLLHMRYLDLSHTEITELPESVCNLCNLQTLILANCNKLIALPKGTKNLVNLRHLNLTGCWHLKSMPPSFGKLTSLQRLHRFVVGKGDDCGISELKDMNELRAALCIDRVEDVLNIEDAKEASLKSKQHIRKLVLRWSRSRYSGGTIDEKLLECLEPHINLKELTVDVYPGTRFPNWMGSSLLSHLESIEFIHCNYCKTLPPLGQLPFLKSLTIYMMQEVERIGREFYGEGKIKGFQALKKLKLGDMRSLEGWLEIDKGEFPVLEELSLLNCPNVTNIPKFPAVKDFLLDNCHEKVLRSVHFLTSLSSLKILNFRNLDLLPDGLLRPLTELKELKIQHFYRLKVLPEEVGLRELKSVQRLEILCCPKLESFAEKGLPCKLQYLSIGMCNNMKDLPRGLEKLPSLQELNITKCPRLSSFPDEKLPGSLKNLRISACANLEYLPTGLYELANLEYLSIQSCQKLPGLPDSGLPSTLRTLSIMECAALEERCAEGGEDWPKIQHIPEKHIRLH